MSDIDIINQALGTKYSGFYQISSNKEALATCFNDERLYKYINQFYMQAWTDENQDLFADISESYLKKGYSVPYYLKIKNPKLLTNCYLYGTVNLRYVEPEAFNEENIKLAFEKNNYSVYWFQKSPVALKVYLENQFNYDINFDSSTWTQENINLYVRNISNFPNIPSFYSNEMCFKEVIRNHRFDFIHNFYFGSTSLDEEIGELLYQKMIEYPNDIVEVKIARLNNIAHYYLKALIETKKFNLIESALNNDSLTEDNITLLSENIEEYLNATDYLNATNGRLNYFLSNNSRVLEKLIELKRFDIIYNNFQLVEWSYDEIKSYFDLNLEKKYYDRFEHNPLALKVYILGGYKLDVRFSNFNDNIVWTDENIELYFDYLSREKPDALPLYSFCRIDNFSNRCLEHNVFKYLDQGDNYIDYDLLCAKIREFPNEDFVIKTNFVNSRVLEAMVDSKNFSLIDKYAHWCHDNIDEVVFSKFAEILDEYLKSGYEIPSNLCKSPKVLKKKIELNNFNNFTLFSSTWDEETIAQLTNKYIQGYLSFDNIPCRDKAYLHYTLYYLNVFKKSSYAFGYSSYKDSFFRYLEENRICDINELLAYFKNKKVLDEYVQDGYLTDKFKKILIFNYGYQCYCRDSEIDIFDGIDDPCLLSYLKCAYKVSNLHTGIFINETNYMNYFDEKGPKQELYDFLFNPNSIGVFKELFEQYPDDKIDKLKIYAVEKFIGIDDFRIKRLCFSYFIDNYDIMDEKKIDDLMNLTYRIEYSNSIELHEFQSQILSIVLESDDPYKKLDKIENIFLKENVPMFSKIYLCFKFLYPNFSKLDKDGNELFNFNEHSRISPDLLLADPNNKRMQLFKKLVNGDKTKIRFQLVYNMLLRCSICNGDASLINYLNILKDGNDIVIKLENADYNIKILDSNERKIFETFIGYLSTIHENMNDSKLEEKSLVDKCKILTDYFKPTSRYSLADRVVRSFGYFAGIDSLEQIFTLINNVRLKAQHDNSEFGKYLNSHYFEFKDGDLLRGIGCFNVVGGSLESGNLCKELLGPITGKSDTDTTPMDYDLTLIEKKGNMYQEIDGTPTGWGFGNIFVVLKDDYTVTRDKEGNLLDVDYDPMKLEVFGSKTTTGGYMTHWGGSGGFSGANIKTFIYKKVVEISKAKPYNDDGSVNYFSKTPIDDLPYVKFEIARHGLYIPIVDLSGKLIFSEDEYNMIRSKMAGLSHYGCDEYHVDKDSLYFDGIDDLVSSMKSDEERVSNVRQAIYDRIKDIVTDPQYGLNIHRVDDVFNGDLSRGISELLETGSTSRFSSVPGDSDFDFILKIDREYISKFEKVERIIEILKSELKPSSLIPTKKNRFRGTGINISGFSDLDIDISIEQRKNNDSYSSEMCLNDRYESIKKQHPDCYPLVLANVVKAKQFLKQKGIYKTIEGGMGGIGVENWILQYGGSFKLAAQDFINHAYRDGELISYDEFRRTYYVFDFGTNHEPRFKFRSPFYPHNDIYYGYDNYIADNLKEQKYKEMAQALKQYVDQFKMQNGKSI